MEYGCEVFPRGVGEQGDWGRWERGRRVRVGAVAYGDAVEGAYLEAVAFPDLFHFTQLSRPHRVVSRRTPAPGSHTI